MTEARAQAGIQKLLQAEHEAAQVVTSARAEKVTRLKQAKDEAEQEIDAYKQHREGQFQVFAKDRMGGTGAHQKSNQESVNAELADIAAKVKANKNKMVDKLLQSVTTVGN